MSTFRLLVTGSRDWTDWQTIDRELTAEIIQLPAGSTFIVVQGQCPDGGADAILERWALSPVIAARHPEYTIVSEPHPADWFRDCDHHCHHRPRKPGARCPTAGPLRNQGMVDLGADKCLAFPLPGSRGTWDCVRRAKKAGLLVQVI